MTFPLYDMLIKDITTKNLTNKELTDEEKNNLIESIPLLDQGGHEVIFTLIRVHGLRTNVGENIFDIPYDGQKVDKSSRSSKDNIKFSIDKLPLIVVQMIYRFVLIHKKSMIGEIYTE